MNGNRHSLLLITALCGVCTSVSSAAERWPDGLQRVRTAAESPFVLADGRQPLADIVLASRSPLVRNAAEWIAAFVRRNGGAELAIGDAPRLDEPRSRLLAVVGDDSPLVQRLAAEGKLQLQPLVGPQGFVIQRVPASAAGDLLVCWSPSELGCRYGLIEILRSLRVADGCVTTGIGRIVDRPHFPMRICYVNFAEHLQNAFNPNLLFDSPVNRWSRDDWQRFIDMVSACRYNVFEFWLVPTLFSPEALQGGKIQTDFAETMNFVIAYAKQRGVAVHPIQAVNTVGQNWHYHCPHDPAERAEIIALWDHWSKTLQGNDHLGFFPGDPGGCFRNGCTAETYVDLCLELARVVRANNPRVTLEVGTWGDPFAGWGVPLWQGKPDRAAQAMQYFIGKLPEFPPGTFTSINLGFSPDCLPTSHGGDGREFAKAAAKTHPVLTWDYSVTEGEGTVSPRCRIRRMFERRREELTLGCYSGGICYTMAPKLNCASIFGCAEAYWNPAQEPDAVLADFGRLVFGEPQAAIGPLYEEFEVIPDWGYYPPFPYSPQRLRDNMAKLCALLEQAGPGAESRLPLATTTDEYRRNLLFFAELFHKLALAACSLEELTAVARQSGKLAADAPGPVPLIEAEEWLADAADFPHRARIAELVAELRRLDVRALRKSYWDKVYGIYDVIPHPIDPRAQAATDRLFERFHGQLAVAYEPTKLEQTLRAKQPPYLLVDLGSAAGERRWTLSGWPVSGTDDGEDWRASFDEPGLIVRRDFRDQGFRWLVVRLTEGPAGGRKTISLNGRPVGEFVRTGPPREQKKEWWVTRSFPIPPGLLRDGDLEIRFTDPGVAISAAALAVEPIHEEQ